MTNSLGMQMLWVPAGEFGMGSAAGDEDEKPVRRVRLNGFYISRFEVMNAYYEMFDARHVKLRSNCSSAPNMPVVNVTWDDAAAFCRWLSQKEGRTCRLPTEAEWEYAARGDDARRFPWGDEPPATGDVYRANFGEGKSKDTWARDGFAYVAPSGRFASYASPFGCQDMAGNVWEWCADWYGPYPSSGALVESPRGPSTGTERVARGGSWYNDPSSLRCANRWSRKPTVRSPMTGFRFVMEAD